MNPETEVRFRPAPWHDSAMWSAEQREWKMDSDIEKLRAVFRVQKFWQEGAFAAFMLNFPAKRYVELGFLQHGPAGEEAGRLAGPGYSATAKLWQLSEIHGNLHDA